MRSDIAILEGYTNDNKNTYIDGKTGFVVSQCDDEYNPQKKLGFSNDNTNFLMDDGLPICAANSNYSGACFTQYYGYDSGEYKIKICHIGNGYKHDNSCVVLGENSSMENFSTSSIKTFGFDVDGYTGGYEYGDGNCPELKNQINGLGYGYIYSATSNDYKSLDDYILNYCEPLAQQYAFSACDSPSICPCDIECRSNGFMPNYNSDTWKNASDRIKTCYKCHQKSRGISFLCEKIYRCAHKNRGLVVNLLTGENRKKYSGLYGPGQYICGYYNGVRCGCSKLRLIGGVRHFLRLARVDDTNNAGCYGENDDDTLKKIKNSPQCNLFEDQLSVRQFYDSKYTDDSDKCPENHNAELGYEYRGGFFNPNIIVKAGKNERLLKFNIKNIKSNPNYYYNTPITKGTSSLINTLNIPTASSVYFSNFYPIIFTIGGTHKVFETYNTCTTKSTGKLYFVLLRLEYNISTGLSQLVAYEVKPSKIKTSLYDNPLTLSDGSIHRFIIDRSVIKDFAYDYDKNIQIVNYKLDDYYSESEYPYLTLTKIGEVNRPPLMYGYLNDNYSLSSPVYVGYDYSAIVSSSDVNSNKIKITLDPSRYNAIDWLSNTEVIGLPSITKTLSIRGINKSAYKLNGGELKYDGDATSNRALLYMQSFTVDYINPCSILQNFTSSPSMDILSSPPESIDDCKKKGTAVEKLACYTTLQLLDECNGYETCLSTDTTLRGCYSAKSPKLSFITDNDSDLEDYKVNKDWRAKPRICIISGFTFAEHLGDLPNTKKFGDFGDPRYDYAISIKRPNNTLFPATESIVLSQLGKQKSHISVGAQQIYTKYVLPVSIDYFNEKEEQNRSKILIDYLDNSYIFDLNQYKNTEESILKNYFPECIGDSKFKCNDKFEIRLKKQDETFSDLCTDGDGMFGSGGWSNLEPRDLGVDYDIYIPYRCQFVDVSLFGAGGAGMTTENATTCLNVYALHGVTWKGKWIFWIEIPNWDIKAAPKFDSTGGGGGYLHSTINLNNINVFDRYLQLRIGSATSYTRHTIHGYKTGGIWCYVGTSANVNEINGGYKADSDWVVTGGSHSFWYRSFNSESDGTNKTGIFIEDEKKGNTEIGFTNYDQIGSLSGIDLANIETQIANIRTNIIRNQELISQKQAKIDELSVYQEYKELSDGCNNAKSSYNNAKIERNKIEELKKTYQQTITNKNMQITNKQTQISEKEAEITAKINEKDSATDSVVISNLEMEISNLRVEITNLQSEIDKLKEEIEGTTDCGDEEENGDGAPSSDPDHDYKAQNRCLNKKVNELNSYEYAISDEDINQLEQDKNQSCDAFDEYKTSHSSISETDVNAKIEILNSLQIEIKTLEEQIVSYNKELNKFNKQKQANNEPIYQEISTAKHGMSPIDCRILGTQNCPIVFTTATKDYSDKYLQVQLYAPSDDVYATQMAVSLLSFLASSIYYKTSNDTKYTDYMTKVKIADIKDNKYNGNLCDNNPEYSIGTYEYIANYLVGENVENASAGHNPKCVKNEASCGALGKKYNHTDSGLRNGTETFVNTDINVQGQSTDSIDTDKHNIYNSNIGMGGAFIHRKSTGGGGEGKAILSLVNPKIKYKTDPIYGSYADLKPDGDKQFDRDGQTDDKCVVRCPPIYVKLTDKNFVFPNGDSASLDLVCEYVGVPDSDMEVDNASDEVSPKKCYIISDTINTEYGDKNNGYSLMGKIIKNEKYCGIASCINGTYSDDYSTSEFTKKQYSGDALMCKHNASGYERNPGGSVITRTSRYYSMLASANIYSGMSFEGFTSGYLNATLFGSSSPIAKCADDGSGDNFIPDKYEFLSDWKLKCGNGFWQLADKVDPKMNLYSAPTEKINVYYEYKKYNSNQDVKYYDFARDNHYTENNKPMWYTDWTIKNHVYNIDTLKTTGIKNLDEYLSPADNENLSMKRFVLNSVCPPINADMYNFDPEYSGNANWDASPENSGVITAKSCKKNTLTSVTTLLPTRKCMRNGMWGPVQGVCQASCVDETDMYGVYWGLYDKDGNKNYVETTNPNEIKVYGYCSGSKYLNSRDYQIKTKQIDRICNISNGKWAEAIKHDCDESLICINNSDILATSVYIPYFRKIKQSYNKYFTEIAQKNAENDISYTINNISEPDESMYLMFDNSKKTSGLGFDYFEIKKQDGKYFVDVAIDQLSSNNFSTSSYTLDENKNILINSNYYNNWFILQVNNNFSPQAYSYMIPSTDDRNEFLNVYNWVSNINYKERNYTGKWAYKCNLSKTKSSILKASKEPFFQERYKNSKLVIFIPVLLYANDNVKHISLFSPKLAFEYAKDNGYTDSEARNLIKDDVNISFRIPTTIPYELRYMDSSVYSIRDTEKLSYPDTFRDDYPMIIYNGKSSQRVYKIVDKINNEIGWDITSSKVTDKQRDCNGKYIGYIKHNTMKHTMYTEATNSEDIYFLSAYCYNGYIFGYNGMKIKFAQDSQNTISSDSKDIVSTPSCFVSDFNDNLPSAIYNYMVDKYTSISETNDLYPIHKNSYIASMFVKYWKAHLLPEEDKQNYFINNYDKSTADTDETINYIYEQYEKGKEGRYYRILPRRVDWISNTYNNISSYENPTIYDLTMLDLDDPYCKKDKCRNKILESNRFNEIVDVDKMYKTGEICSSSINAS